MFEVTPTNAVDLLGKANKWRMVVLKNVASTVYVREMKPHRNGFDEELLKEKVGPKTLVDILSLEGMPTYEAHPEFPEMSL